MSASEVNLAERIEALFHNAAFVGSLGIVLDAVGEGWCEAHLDVRPEHEQQDGYVHAGVVATLADHAAGGAAMTLISPEHTVLSIEFKVNMLRPAVGERLRCRAEVLKAGRTISVVEASVFAIREAEAKLVAKATLTMAVVEKAAAVKRL